MAYLVQEAHSGWQPETFDTLEEAIAEAKLRASFPDFAPVGVYEVDENDEGDLLYLFYNKQVFDPSEADDFDEFEV